MAMKLTVESALIGMRIAELRKAAGLRQQDLADAVSLTRSSIANIESGRQQLSVTHLQAIARVLGSAVAEITQAPAMPWHELAKRTFASERHYQQLAEQAWRSHDYLTAIRYRGMAEGIGVARQHHLDVVADRPSGPEAAVA